MPTIDDAYIHTRAFELKEEIEKHHAALSGEEKDKHEVIMRCSCKYARAWLAANLVTIRLNG